MRGADAGASLETKVKQSLKNGDFASLNNLINEEEALWKKQPSVAYFHDMFCIGDTLTGGTTAQSYWLGRKALWDMLLKPVPSEFGAAQIVYGWKQTMLKLSAEAITPYVNNLSPDMFAAARHDTFLMLQEYASQLHQTIIPGYRDKYSGAMNDWAEKQRFKQNAVGNQIQAQARIALANLPTSHVQYLIDAYSHEPRDDKELEALMDILNLKQGDRNNVWRDTR
jgi:hypothetical protein